MQRQSTFCMHRQGEGVQCKVGSRSRRSAAVLWFRHQAKCEQLERSKSSKQRHPEECCGWLGSVRAARPCTGDERRSDSLYKRLDWRVWRRCMREAECESMLSIASLRMMVAVTRASTDEPQGRHWKPATGRTRSGQGLVRRAAPAASPHVSRHTRALARAPQNLRCHDQKRALAGIPGHASPAPGHSPLGPLSEVR